jgi:hypothetical protein
MRDPYGRAPFRITEMMLHEWHEYLRRTVGDGEECEDSAGRGPQSSSLSPDACKSAEATAVPGEGQEPEAHGREMMARVTYRDHGRVSNGPKGHPHMPLAFVGMFLCQRCIEEGRNGRLEAFYTGDGQMRVYCPACNKDKATDDRNVFPQVRHVASVETERLHRFIEAGPDSVAVEVGSLLRSADEEEDWL